MTIEESLPRFLNIFPSMDCNAGGSEKTEARSGVSLRVISNGCELLDPSIRLLGGIFDKAITGSLFGF